MDKESLASSGEPDLSNFNKNPRVKLYILNENRAWDDQGIAHVTAMFVNKLKGISLVVRKEHEYTLMLESKIQPYTAYQKQQETLIVWSEPDSFDYALSFQDKSGCDEIWEKICQVQGKDPSVEITQDVLEPETEEMDDDHFEDMHDTTAGVSLPPCELSRLEEISELFNASLLTPIKREKLTILIENEGYIKKLIDLFHMCEDLDNLEGLHHLYNIFKSLFLLNKTALFEIMFTDDMIFDVVGVLEYDPASQQPVRHREFLRTQTKLKEVIPLNNTELVQKIHQTYRVQYIQDMILPAPSVFEENLLSTLTSFIYFNKMEIVTMIQEDSEFLKLLFRQLADDETDDDKRRDLLLFLKEFCTFSQTLAQQNKEAFFKVLSDLGLLNMLEVIMGLDDPVMKSTAVDIFSYVVEFNPSMVRDFILHEGQKQDDDDLLINLVIEQMISDTDPEMGGALQLMGIIRLLIDPENMVGKVQKAEKSEFLGFFYPRCMHVLTAPLCANTVDDKPSKDDYQIAQLLSLIIELLTFCVEHHTYHIKQYIINKNLLSRVLVLLKSRHAFLNLSALRLLRRTIGLKDEIYHKHIIKVDLFKPLAEAFARNGKRYNLFNSAVIELFEYIKTEDIKSLITYFVERHYKSFEDVNYVQTFKVLKQRHEQHQDRLINRAGALETYTPIRSRFRRDARSLEEEEEMWFDQDDDFDDSDLSSKVDLFKTKLDVEYEPLNKLLGNNKPGAQPANFGRKSPPAKAFSKSAISINIHSSLTGGGLSPNPTTPASSPTNSPSSSPGRPTTPPSQENNPPVSTKRPGIVGLVDYPDEDSEEDDNAEDPDTAVPPAKKPRLST